MTAMVARLGIIWYWSFFSGVLVVVAGVVVWDVVVVSVVVCVSVLLVVVVVIVSGGRIGACGIIWSKTMNSVENS